MHHELSLKRRCCSTNPLAALFAPPRGNTVGMCFFLQGVTRSDLLAGGRLTQDMLIGLSDEPPEILTLSPYREGLLWFSRDEPLQEAMGT